MGNPISICPTCGSIVAPDDLFCSHCGAKVTNVVQTIGIGRQIYIYAVSLLLPPLGLIWTWKYLRTDNSQIRRVGLIAAGITVVSIILTIWVTVGFFQGIQSQLTTYSNLGL